MEPTKSASYQFTVANFADVFHYIDLYYQDSTCFYFNNQGYILGLYPTLNVRYFDDQIGLGLFQNAPLSSGDLMMKISLIDENGDPRFVNESVVSFDTSQVVDRSYLSATNGGLYKLSRGLIMNPSNRLLSDGRLTIRCELTLLDNDALENRFEKLSIQAKELITAQENSAENNRLLLESEKYSDVLFVVKNKEFRLHKNIMAAQSLVFAAMFDSGLEESKQNRVLIPDVEVDVFELLIGFIYTTKYDPAEPLALDLFVAADKYQLDNLKDLCAYTLGTNLDVDSVVDTLLFAYMHSSPKLRSKCIDYINLHASKVMQTEGWKGLKERPQHFGLLLELYENLVLQVVKKK